MAGMLAAGFCWLVVAAVAYGQESGQPPPLFPEPVASPAAATPWDGPEAARCSGEGESCGGDFDCCGGRCRHFACEAASRSCRQPGAPCATSVECCAPAYCDLRASACRSASIRMFRAAGGCGRAGDAELDDAAFASGKFLRRIVRALGRAGAALGRKEPEMYYAHLENDLFGYKEQWLVRSEGGLCLVKLQKLRGVGDPFEGEDYDYARCDAAQRAPAPDTGNFLFYDGTCFARIPNIPSRHE